MELVGRVIEGEFAYQRKTYVRPITYLYNDPNEEMCIKYSCPVCEMLNNRFSFSHGVENCPQCNVNLYWDGVM